MFEEIIPGLFVIYSSDQGANSYLLIGRKTVLIDSDLGIAKDSLRNGLKGIGLEPEDIDLVLHTHGHADHFAADSIFSNAELAMHKYDASYVNLKDKVFTVSDYFQNTCFPKISRTFDEKELIEVNPFQLRVLFTPGHTLGSVCFFEEKNKILFSGDTLFKGSVGRCDLPSGNKKELKESLQMLRKRKHKILCPGHGLVLKENTDINLDQALSWFTQTDKY